MALQKVTQFLYDSMNRGSKCDFYMFILNEFLADDYRPIKHSCKY